MGKRGNSPSARRAQRTWWKKCLGRRTFVGTDADVVRAICPVCNELVDTYIEDNGDICISTHDKPGEV